MLGQPAGTEGRGGVGQRAAGDGPSSGDSRLHVFAAGDLQGRKGLPLLEESAGDSRPPPPEGSWRQAGRLAGRGLAPKPRPRLCGVERCKRTPVAPRGGSRPGRGFPGATLDGARSNASDRRAVGVEAEGVLSQALVLRGADKHQPRNPPRPPRRRSNKGVAAALGGSLVPPRCVPTRWALRRCLMLQPLGRVLPSRVIARSICESLLPARIPVAAFRPKHHGRYLVQRHSLVCRRRVSKEGPACIIVWGRQ
mmetsp:Transcript_37843/g.89851  ORF Transcript_37843/g.89851 Transcript_37843/m.89851 type:complete len:252 (+) Transcript_37843:1252-2007(+)